MAWYKQPAAADCSHEEHAISLHQRELEKILTIRRNQEKRIKYEEEYLLECDKVIGQQQEWLRRNEKVSTLGRLANQEDIEKVKARLSEAKNMRIEAENALKKLHKWRATTIEMEHSERDSINRLQYKISLKKLQAMGMLFFDTEGSISAENSPFADPQVDHLLHEDQAEPFPDPSLEPTSG